MNQGRLMEVLEREDALDAMKIDGFDKAIIGVAEGRVVYRYELIIQELMKAGLDEEEATDYYYYNIDGSMGAFGSKAPIVVEE